MKEATKRELRRLLESLLERECEPMAAEVAEARAYAILEGFGLTGSGMGTLAAKELAKAFGGGCCRAR